jgi:ADP-ribosylglycohydrolase
MSVGRGEGDDGGGTGRLPVRSLIAGALTAYACGDAFGLPWEGRPPGTATPDRAVEVPARARWIRGSTSDDTALTLLVAEHLIAHGGSGDPADFLRTLADQAESIHGLGPSTIAAIQRFQLDGQLPTEGGRTNGAVMRALPIGWATPADASELRRRWAVRLSSATHPGAEAQAAACLMATCASWAVEGADVRALLAAAQAEASALRAAGMTGSLDELVRAVSQGTWTPPSAGIGLDPLETVGAVLHCVATAQSLGSAMLTAVALGGDTDTVAALVGGILGCGRTPDEIRAELAWSKNVLLPPADTVQSLADGLAELRRRQVRST